MEQYDVVVVGGGIAGSAVAATLAAADLTVLVLERQTVYRDKVRGEYMHPWGVAEMLRLGLEQTLLEAGGTYSGGFVNFGDHIDPHQAIAAAIPLGMLLPDVQGAMCVGHPQASEALNTHAERRGAVVVRGVGDVEVTAGASPVVSYEFDGVVYQAACRLIVGADGRQSTVRRSLEIPLHQTESKATLGGMLVHAPSWNLQSVFTGNEGDRYVLGFPRRDGLVRLYLACEPGTPRSGPDRTQHMLDAFQLDCVPESELLATAQPVGPCSYYMGSDAWVDNPAVEGAVLVGDAAGWSDPIIGEGLSVALRDARSVVDVLLASDDWSVAAFGPYAAERAERMRRLRVTGHVSTEIRATFTPEGRARRVAFIEQTMTDPLILGMLLSSLIGPETGPVESFEDAHVERILALV